jgi:predicted MFS family arabinose efflux permease
MPPTDGVVSKGPGRPEQRATRLAFFIVGVGVATWAPLVPFAQSRAGLDEQMLGLLLLCLGAGSIVAMPLAGALAARVGCRRVLIPASLLLCLLLPWLATASTLATLVPALLAFGAAIGTLDCVMNIQAVIVERASLRPMMSGFHGLYSVGGIVGSGGVSALLGAGASPLAATICTAFGILVALSLAGRHFLSYATESPQAGFVLPHGVVLLIGVLCFVVFLTEGAVLDWSAVFLVAARGVDPSYAGLGYSVFALTMTCGRLTGDRIVRRLGGTLVTLGGGLCAATGLATVALAPGWGASMVGYALVGAGCSNIVPVLYTAVGRQKIMAEHSAISAVTSIGYAGILAGPALIGFVAHATSLTAAFLMLAGLMLGVGVCGRKVGR